MKRKRDATDQKLRGAYYTPYALAAAMVRLCPHGAESILEPSCGDGVFLEALSKNGHLCEDTRLDAVEIEAEPLKLAASRLQHNRNFAFHNLDFFEFYRGKTTGSYDLIIGNPPYIRYQYMSPDERAALSNLLTKHGMRANRLINTWVGFMVACADLLVDGGCMSFVVPAELLQVAYAEDLRHFLASHFSEISILTFSKLIFPDIEQEVVAFFGIKGSGSSKIRVIQFDDADSIDFHAIDAIDFQPLLSTEEKWTRHFVGARDSILLDQLLVDQRLIPFSNLALVNVGVTTGDNKFFSLNEETTQKYDLGSSTIPLIGRSSHASGLFFTQADWQNNLDNGKAARLLTLNSGEYDHLSSVQKCYIDAGEANGVNRGYKCSIRESWYSIPSIWIPDAFFLRRNNLFPKLVLNCCDAISTDTMHRIKIRPEIDKKLLVLCYYNSISFAFTELCGRSYGGGVLEILPKEVGRILVPNPDKFSLTYDEIEKATTLIDFTLRSQRDIEDALDYVDNLLLCRHLGFKMQDCIGCRRIWKTLQQRRLLRTH